jgi:hypothetical protein
MCHLPAGISGLLVGFASFIAIGLLVRLTITREAGPYNLDPQGTPHAFEPFLVKYLRLGEFIVGLAAGSIVLLLSSAALHSGGTLPPYYASPLLLLGCCVLYGIAFMVWLIYHYEDHQHGAKHTRAAYTFSLTTGFSALACFVIGYAWLIFQFTRNHP